MEHKTAHVGHNPGDRSGSKPNRLSGPGRVAQWESARFTRERSQVRNPPRPFSRRIAALIESESYGQTWIASSSALNLDDKCSRR